MRSFSQVDVFTSEAFRGNPLAVVVGADGMSDQEMAQFANWTNLSETTFLLSPTVPAADYRVRIFTPSTELPFAGHPTIGSCHVWLEAGGAPKADQIVQECGVGLVPLRRSGDRLAFAAPPLIRGGDVDDVDLAQVCRILKVDRSEIVASQWADNGPGWIAVLLKDADAVLALEPDFSAAEVFDVGVVGLRKVGVAGVALDDAVEVRAFFRNGGHAAEDPATGSLNASLAQWLLGSGRVESPYIARQGTAIGRAGRIYIDEADGEIWVGGDAVTCITGLVEL